MISTLLHRICSETGIDFIGNKSLDFVPLNDLNIHKTAFWNLTITSTPEIYFQKINKQCLNKMSYRFKFPIANTRQGLKLYSDLAHELGILTDIPVPKEVDAKSGLYLAIHIHSQFIFTPKSPQAIAPTQTLELRFV